MPIDNDEKLVTLAELAARIGPRRGNRPTGPQTVRSWIVNGVRGVFLRATWDVSMWRVSYGAYLDFCRELTEVKRDGRQARIEAAQRGRTGSRAQQAAAKRLEAMGAR